jgi:hypothetical protein
MKEDYKLNPIIYQVREYTFKNEKSLYALLVEQLPCK